MYICNNIVAIINYYIAIYKLLRVPYIIRNKRMQSKIYIHNAQCEYQFTHMINIKKLRTTHCDLQFVQKLDYCV